MKFEAGKVRHRRSRRVRKWAAWENPADPERERANVEEMSAALEQVFGSGNRT